MEEKPELEEVEVEVQEEEAMCNREAASYWRLSSAPVQSALSSSPASSCFSSGKADKRRWLRTVVVVVVVVRVARKESEVDGGG